jgi:hypothetical protein
MGSPITIPIQKFTQISFHEIKMSADITM